jgi:23S rRNA pseudouridine1911/1915/1917 synthase
MDHSFHTPGRTSTVLTRLKAMFPNAHIGTLRKMVADGRVKLDAVRVRTVNMPVSESAHISIDSAPAESRLTDTNIIYSDADILVYAKPAGMLTSTTRDETRPTLIAMLEKHINRQTPGGNIYLVHRLDRDASGLLIFARDVKSLANLKMQFRRHTITRRYQAWVHGTPGTASAECNDKLAEDDSGRVFGSLTGKPARLHYRRVKSVGRHTLLDVELYTGRKHQIRVQLAIRGFPVVGDRVYGKADGQKRLSLHAVELIIHHPRTGQRMAFHKPPPADFHPRQATAPLPQKPPIKRKRRHK